MVGAAAGGSALGSLILGLAEKAVPMFLPMFAFSMLFTLVGGVLLTVVGYGLRASLERSWWGYLPIAIVALIAGPLMMMLAFGVDGRGVIIGAIFALLTAIVWSVLHRTLHVIER
jgi:hypothetical protein